MPSAVQISAMPAFSQFTWPLSWKRPGSAMLPKASVSAQLSNIHVEMNALYNSMFAFKHLYQSRNVTKYFYFVSLLK